RDGLGREETERHERLARRDVEVVAGDLLGAGPRVRGELLVERESAFGDAALVKQEDHSQRAAAAVRERLREDALAEEERSRRHETRTELLVDLAPESLLEALPRLHAAARERPGTGEDAAVLGHLANEHAPLLVANDRHDDEAEGRRRRAHAFRTAAA